MILVFSVEDKIKLETQGYKFICKQFYGDKLGYLFKDNDKLKFNKDEIKYIKTNKMIF